MVTDAAARYQRVVDDVSAAMADEPKIALETMRRLSGTIPVAADGTATITLVGGEFVV